MRRFRIVLSLTCFTLALPTIFLAGCGADLTQVGQPVATQATPEVQPERDANVPAAVLAVGPGKQLSRDAIDLMNSANAPPMYVGLATGMIHQALDAIDRTKPSGMLIFCKPDQETPDWLACLPVADLEEFSEAGGSLGIKLVDEGSEQKLSVKGAEDYFTKYSEGYLFIAEKNELLKLAPKDPSAEFEELLQSQSVAFRVDAQRLPESWKESAWKSLQATARKSDPDNADAMVQQLNDYVYGVKKAVVRLNLDANNKKLRLEGTVEGLDGSSIAIDSARELKREPTKFAGFGFSKSTLIVNCCSDSLVAHIEKIGELSGQGSDLSAFAKDVDDEIRNRLWESLEATIKEGRVDMGATVAAKDGKPNLAFGLHVAGADKAAETVEELLEMFASADQVVQRDFATHDGITFHQIKMDEAAFGPLLEMYGPQSTVILGASENELYLSMGEDALNILKICIKRSKKMELVSTAKVQARILSISRYLTPRMSRNMTDAYRSVGDNDRFVFETHPCENGFVASVDIEVGFITGAMAAVEEIGLAPARSFETSQR